MKRFKKFVSFFFGLCLIFFISEANILAANPYVLYEQKDEKLITKNLVYSAYKQITTEGMRDFYVLRVPLNDSNITLKSAESVKEYGLKETTQVILEDNNAIAGVNCDFFGMKGNYSAPFSTIINGGKLISLNPSINFLKDEYSSFAIDSDNNPFMAYVKSEVEFLNGGRKNIDVVAVNKITDMIFPIYIDRNAMISTETIDKHFLGIVKIVVSGGQITYISKKGETVDIPEDGYIITMSSHTADYNLNKFSVGQKTEFGVKSSVDLGKINTMFGGIGRILINGKFVNNSGIVPKHRQPRTALGLTYDRNTVVIMVVDGRTHSIGATNEEMSILMKRFGAYNAMYLDGGGSSTMVVQNMKTDKLNVVNTLSDGLQRKVVNALGIFKPNEIGQLDSIKIETENDKVIEGLPFKIKVYGLDEYLNKIEILASDFALISDDENGKFDGENFYPSKTGKIKLSVQYENFIADKEIICVEPNVLEPVKKILTAEVEKPVDLLLNVICDDGTKLKLYDSNIKFDIVPNDLGIVEDNKFTLLKSGSGYIKCSCLGLDCYIEIISSDKENDFDETDVPENKKFHDKLNIDFDDKKIPDGNFDIFCIGNMFLIDKNKPEDYKKSIDNFLDKVSQKSSLGLFVGNVDVNLDIKTFRHKNNYSVNVFKNVSVINMTAEKGCLFKTNTKQWQSFETDIKNKNSDHIIIMLDKNPMTFNPSKEYELFHSVLKKFVDDGKNVFVLYSNLIDTQAYIKDGVRYVNIGSLYEKNNTLNQNYKSLKLRVANDSIIYKFQ